MTEENSVDIISQLAKMRVPFEEHQISKLPKPTRVQTDAVKKDFKLGARCNLCGGWHHPKVVHLDYVGHAALTDRLLDVDPLWNWEPVKRNEDGSPVADKDGGMWIKLTVCGVSRLGYGDSGGKTGGNATKERIGDALRNAAMRFGAALDLWHKGELHQSDEPQGDPKSNKPEGISIERFKEGINHFRKSSFTPEKLSEWFESKNESYNVLSKKEQAELTGVFNDVVAWLDKNGKHGTKEKAGEPETVKCPESGRNVVKADCMQSECHKTCKAMGNTHESKLEIDINE